MEAIARLIVLMAIFVAPDYSLGLVCKVGVAYRSSENATIGTCKGGDADPAAQYCLDVICVKENMPKTAVMFWACSDENDKKACTDYFENAYNKTFHTTNASCKCNFGEKGKDRTNLEAKLPEIPQKPTVSPEAASVCKQPGFKCKFGIYNEHGYGQTSIGDCKEGVYCYAITCNMGKSNFTFWGVATENDCYKLSDYFAFGFPCHCEFGEKGVEMSNMNFMLPTYLVPSSALVSVNRGIRANFSILFVWLMSSAFFLAVSASLLKKQ